MLAFKEKAKTIRDQSLADDSQWKHKPRFALFSYTPAAPNDLAFDDSFVGRRDAKGKVRLDPKNFLTRKNDLFSKPVFLAETSKYMDRSKIQLFRSDKKGPKTPFISPAKLPKQIKGPYDYFSGKSDETSVGFGKKGFYTAGPKTGFGTRTYGHLFSQPFEHISDPYDRKQEKEAKDREGNKKKALGRSAFVSTFHEREHFTSNKDTFYSPERKGRSNEEVSPKRDPKQKAFVPSSPAKIGFNRTFGKFPEYMSSPIPSISPQKNSNKAGYWKYTHRDLTAPSTSIKMYNEKFRPRGNL